MSDPKTPPRHKGRQWPYRASLPQRYAVDVESYKRVGGSIDLDSFVKGFLPEGTQSGANQSCAIKRRPWVTALAG